MEVSKLHQLKRKEKIGIHSLHRNKKVPHKIVQKIDIKNVTRIFSTS